MRESRDQRILTYDCSGWKIGRLLEELSSQLRATNSLSFEPRNVLNLGVDRINLIHAESLKVGRKKYYFHSGYAGGFKVWFADELILKNPSILIKRALWGVMPKNKSSRQLIKRVRIYSSKDKI